MSEPGENRKQFIMTMTDPVADMLTRLRNANRAYHETVSLPSSKLKTHIAEILQKEGYITGWKTEDARVGQTLTIDLKYGPNRERSLAGIKRVSKPGLRVYAKSTEILSTSSGLLTDRQAVEKGVGGEVLAYVW
jgi:small subunit ribosomal protein S8